MEQIRDKAGKFILKGEEIRKVRAVRLTNSTWNKLGKIANERSITRTDLIEELLNQDNIDIDEVVRILKEALTLKANAGGAIKEKIKLVIKKLDF